MNSKALADRVSALEGQVQRLAERLEAPATPAPPPPPEPLPNPEPPYPAPPAPEPAAHRLVEVLQRTRRPVVVRERPEWDWARIERTLGRQWMTWAGVLALFLATGFFVKYAMERGWLGPTARVVLGLVAGAAMVVGGHVCVRRRLAALGQGLMGGGVAILYLSLYASFTLYHLVPQIAAFSGMAAVTAGGLALAVRHDARVLSFLALLGGLLTPVLLSTGTDARDALFGYLLVLDLGALGVALFKEWRGLDALALAGTVTLYAGWYHQFYAAAALGPALAWLGAFYVVFLLLPFVHHFRRGTPIPVERFLMALANATFALGFANDVLGRSHEHALGLVCIGMAGCYAALGGRTRRRIPSDARALFGFAGLAVLCASLSVPLLLRLRAITVGWAAEAVFVYFLGCVYAYGPLRAFGFVVLVTALNRLVLVDAPAHHSAFRLFANRPFLTALCVPAAGAAIAFLGDLWAEGASPADRVLKRVAGIGAGLLLLALLHVELWQWYRFAERAALGRSVLALLWSAGAVAFVLAGLRLRSAPVRVAGLAPLLMAVVLALVQFRGTPELLVLNRRFATALVTVGAVFACGLLCRTRRAGEELDEGMALGLPWVGLALLLTLLSAEPYTYWRDTVADPERARWISLASVSIVWAAYAAALLVIGFWRRRQSLRLAALALFGATAVKLAAVDIAGVERIYRVAAFLVLGLLMVGGAYLYNRIERHLLTPESAG